MKTWLILFLCTLVTPLASGQHTTPAVDDTVSAGSFNRPSYIAYKSSTIGGWSLSNYVSSTGTVNALEGMSGRIQVPPGANLLGTSGSHIFYGGAGVAGYCLNQADTRLGGSGKPGNHNNCEALFGLSQATANDSAAWGWNTINSDAEGTRNTYLVSGEMDIGVNGSPEAVWGMQVLLGGNGTMPAYKASGLSISGNNGGTKAVWPFGVIIGGGVSTAIQIQPNHVGAGQAAAPINFVRFDSDGKYRADVSVTNDPAGDFVVQTSARGTAVLGTNFEGNQGTGCTSGNVAVGTGWGTAASTGTFSGYSQTCQFVITTGSGAFSTAPTITFTFPNAFPTAPVCTLDVHAIMGSGGAIMFDNTTPSKTAPVFTATTPTGSAFTPAASESYKVVLRCGP